MSSLQAFISVMDEFLQELTKTFPEEKQIKVYYNTFKTMKKVNSRKILDSFMAEVQKHSDKIINKDESYFLDTDDEFLNSLNIKKWWKDDISDATKAAIWQYMNTLFVLGTTINSIPQDLLKTIESVAEDCASKMGDNPNSVDMGNLMAGMQNMIGNILNSQQNNEPKVKQIKTKK
jgi:hypothetical protein